VPGKYRAWTACKACISADHSRTLCARRGKHFGKVSDPTELWTWGGIDICLANDRTISKAIK